MSERETQRFVEIVGKNLNFSANEDNSLSANVSQFPEHSYAKTFSEAVSRNMAQNDRPKSIVKTEILAQDLHKLDLNNKIISDKKFINCDFSDVDFEGYTFQNVEFENCVFSIIIDKTAQGIKTISGTSFNKSELKDVVFKLCTLVKVDFREIISEGLVFSGSELSGASFHLSELVEVDFRNTNITAEQLSSARIYNAKFDNLTVMLEKIELAKTQEKQKSWIKSIKFLLNLLGDNIEEKEIRTVAKKIEVKKVSIQAITPESNHMNELSKQHQINNTLKEEEKLVDSTDKKFSVKIEKERKEAQQQETSIGAPSA